MGKHKKKIPTAKVVNPEENSTSTPRSEHEHLKNKGNEYFAKGQYLEAIEQYSLAIANVEEKLEKPTGHSICI